MLIFSLTLICCAQTAQPVTSNINHGVYRFDTGFEQTQFDYRSGPDTIFDGSVGLSYYYIVAGTDLELIDDGSLAQRGTLGQEQVNGISLSYCTSSNQVDCELRFYADNIYNAGPSGWIDQTNRGEACVYGLTGLPGSFSGTGFSCWLLTIDLSGGFECTLPQEQVAGSADSFGWSVQWLTPSSATGLFALNPSGQQGYGTRPSMEVYDLSQPHGSEYQGALAHLGNFNTKWFGNVEDTVAYYPFAPLANDTVRFNALTPIRSGAVASWEVENVDPAATYGMIVSSQSADLPIMANGTASLLLNHNFMLVNPLSLGASGAISATIPPVVLPNVIFTQAVKLNGILSPSNVIAASNGLAHYN
ncbi:MAG: hypothetical protein H8E25_04235 [Planctomycetes bacterium]|nr:hypothetical protein [Planctomycetota bacterium]